MLSRAFPVCALSRSALPRVGEPTLIIYGEFAAAIWALANLLLKKREKAAATFPPQIRHHLPYPRWPPQTRRPRPPELGENAAAIRHIRPEERLAARSADNSLSRVGSYAIVAEWSKALV